MPRLAIVAGLAAVLGAPGAAAVERATGTIRGRVTVPANARPAERPIVGDLPPRPAATRSIGAGRSSTSNRRLGRRSTTLRAEPGAHGPARRAVRPARPRDHRRHDRRLPEQRRDVSQRVLALARASTFDLGRYKPGKTGADPCSTAPGIVPVFCDIHSHMSAYILVFSHPFFAVTDEAGDYVISGIPPGDYTRARSGASWAARQPRRVTLSGARDDRGGLPGRPRRLMSLFSSLTNRIFLAHGAARAGRDGRGDLSRQPLGARAGGEQICAPASMKRRRSWTSCSGSQFARFRRQGQAHRRRAAAQRRRGDRASADRPADRRGLSGDARRRSVRRRRPRRRAARASGAHSAGPAGAHPDLDRLPVERRRHGVLAVSERRASRGGDSARAGTDAARHVARRLQPRPERPRSVSRRRPTATLRSRWARASSRPHSTPSAGGAWPMPPGSRASSRRWLGDQEYVGRVQPLGATGEADEPVAIVLRSRTEHLSFLPPLRWQIADDRARRRFSWRRYSATASRGR